MTINITSSSLRAALTLSAADRRWMDFITQSVNDTWDEANPGRPKTMGYVGSEEFIRLQFEEYLLSLISSVKCHNYLKHHAHNPRAMLPHVEGDPALDFGADWIEAWSRSENYRIWERNTDSHLFDIVEPKHPCAGGLTIDDVQRRIAEQVKEFHLDERFAVGKEILGKNLAAGKEKASTVFNKLYADMEALKESQRKKQEEARLQAEKNGTPMPSPGFQAPDLNGAKQTVQSVGSKAGAYIGSWGTWMGEKRKTGWGAKAAAPPPQNNFKENYPSPPRNEKFTEFSRPIAKSDGRPKTQESYQESIFDAEANGHTHNAKPLVKSPHRNSNAPHPSRFHEQMDDSPRPVSKEAPKRKELKPASVDTSSAEPSSKEAPKITRKVVPEPIESEESKAWGEELPSKIDATERTNAVAEAVEDATATPISP